MAAIGWVFASVMFDHRPTREARVGPYDFSRCLNSDKHLITSVMANLRLLFSVSQKLLQDEEYGS